MLHGPGYWAYDTTRLGDLVSLAERVVAPIGGKWLALKGGDASSYGRFTESLVAAWRSVDVEPVFWWYSKPQQLNSQAEMLRAQVENGVIAFVIDAETEWEADWNGKSWMMHDYRPLARAFSQQIREMIGEAAFFADAPWAIQSAHPVFPFKEFGSICNARMPQFYSAVAALDREWTSPPTPQQLSASAQQFLTRADASWLNEPVPVCPIVSNMNGSGAKRLSPSDLRYAWTRYADRPARSVWSIEWLSEEEKVAITAA